MGEDLKMLSLKLLLMTPTTIFSCPRTPQRNCVVERKNRSLQEMARTLFSESGIQLFLDRSCRYNLLHSEQTFYQ